MKNQEIKVGDKYTFLGEELTVASFYSSDGVEFSSAEECREKNRGYLIYVRNKEFGGGDPLPLITPIVKNSKTKKL